MYRCLSPGAIGINASTEEAINLAADSGFQGVEVNIADLAKRLESSSPQDVRCLFESAGLRIGGWGLPVEFRGEEAAFREQLERLQPLAAAAKALGTDRTFTWISPASDILTFQENFELHRVRMARIAEILKEHGISLGLEFIGPKTLRNGKAYEFIHTMEGMLELCEACGTGNVGLLLDCWHWYTSQGTIDDLKRLRPEQVVYVHVNDAPAHVDVDEQLDNHRCLPGETGVIDIAGFLQSLREIGYAGPVTPEPFSQRVREMSPADAARATGDSMLQIWTQAGLN